MQVVKNTIQRRSKLYFNQMAIIKVINIVNHLTFAFIVSANQIILSNERQYTFYIIL